MLFQTEPPCSSEPVSFALNAMYCFSAFRPTTMSTFFPYTTLFRSQSTAARTGARLLERTGKADARNAPRPRAGAQRSEEHTSELQSPYDLVCRLLLEKQKGMFAIQRTLQVHGLRSCALALTQHLRA